MAGKTKETNQANIGVDIWHHQPTCTNYHHCWQIAPARLFMIISNTNNTSNQWRNTFTVSVDSTATTPSFFLGTSPFGIEILNLTEDVEGNFFKEKREKKRKIRTHPWSGDSTLSKELTCCWPVQSVSRCPYQYAQLWLHSMPWWVSDCFIGTYLHSFCKWFHYVPKIFLLKYILTLWWPDKWLPCVICTECFLLYSTSKQLFLLCFRTFRKVTILWWWHWTHHLYVYVCTFL